MILVTGASGALGSLVTERLKHRSDVIAGTRNPNNTAGDLPSRLIDFDAPESLTAGFSGVDVLMLVSAGYGEDDEVIARHGNAIAAAERAGVGHIVYTSLTGAGDHLAFALPHRWTERRLREGSTNWTILRNGIYAEMSVPDARNAAAAGQLHAPLGEGRIAAVAREDLADVAASILADTPTHRGKIYELIGDRAIGGADIAAAVSATTGKETPYVSGTLASLRAMLGKSGVPAWQIPIVVSTYSSIAAGFLGETDGHLKDLLARPSRSALDVIVSAI